MGCFDLTRKETLNQLDDLYTFRKSIESTTVRHYAEAILEELNLRDMVFKKRFGMEVGMISVPIPNEPENLEFFCSSYSNFLRKVKDFLEASISGSRNWSLKINIQEDINLFFFRKK